MKFVKLHLSGALVVDFVLRVTKEARLSFIDVFLYLFFMITESNANQKRYTLLFYKNMYNFARPNISFLSIEKVTSARSGLV